MVPGVAVVAVDDQTGQLRRGPILQDAVPSIFIQRGALPTTNPQPLFETTVPTSELDPVYVHIRDHVHCDEYRQYLGGLWAEYVPYADRNFLDQLQRRGQFHSRVWEMRLTIVLKRLGLAVAVRGSEAGPDIKIEGTPTTWIEAVAPATTDELERSRELALHGLTPAPEKQVVLRYTQALAEKWGKYLGYTNAGVVKPSDAFVIAVNAANLHTPSLGSGPLWIAKALYGIGDLTWSTEVGTGRHLGSGWSHAPMRYKPKGAAVEADLFLSDKRAGISAVLYAADHLKNWPEVRGKIEGSDFRIFHNEFASVPLPRGLIKRGQEWATGDGMLRMLCDHSVASTDQPASS